MNISPENTEVRFLSAILNQKIGDTAEAVKDYNFLINHKNADVRVFNNLGAIYAKEKRYKEAKELFYKAIKINPDKAEFHNNLSELLMETEDNDRAIEEYDKVIQLEPGNTLALFNLGIAYKNKGDFAKAKEQWNKVLALKPDDTNAKNALEYLEKNGQN